MNDRAPFDRDAETAVLAACWWSRLARDEARRHLIPADFYDPRHQAIFDAYGRLDRWGKPIDHLTVGSITKAHRGVTELLPDLVVHPAVPEHVGTYAAVVRSWATKRLMAGAAREVLDQALNPELNATGYAASVVSRFATIRDSGVTEDTTTRTLAEVLADPDDEPDWLIPGYLERRDRLILTGEEGLGKSHWLRQFAICAAAGIDPFDYTRKHDPVRVLIVDCENSDQQVKRRSRGIAAYAQHYGRPDVTDRVFIHTSTRIDITRDRDLASLHREVDLWTPDLVVIGPLYRLLPRAIQTDDDAAPVLAALDTIRDRGCALLLEAHAGHAVGKGGVRDLRPRGSSALLGWPEFGYGMRDLGARGGRYCQFVSWRGDRSERDWPQAFRRADDGVRWIPYDGPTEIGDVA